MPLRLNPYIVLNGNAREAIAFYQQALDAQVVGIMTLGEMPGADQYVPAEAKERVMHAHLKVGDADLMFSDTFPGQPYQVGNQVTIALHTSSVEEAQRIFAALAEGGRVEVPLQKTDWSPAYGSLVDRFGVPWQINTAAEE
ncbi:MAG: VOC family protein [Bacillota bacterium]|nr:MAG: hypothetical protein DIU70_04765 [Bacillota bacterium]